MKEVKEKTALSRLFDESINQCSPVQKDFVRKVQFDGDGNEFVVYEEFDYPTFQKSLGTVDMWNLDSLLKAGINPDFAIHTGSPTRLDGISTIQDFQSMADKIFAEEENNKE